MMHPPIAEMREPEPLSLVNRLTLQRERVFQRIEGLPPRGNKAIALKAQMTLLTNEILACEPSVRRMLNGAG